jgi:hypothetical protein
VNTENATLECKEGRQGLKKIRSNQLFQTVILFIEILQQTAHSGTPLANAEMSALSDV